MVGTAFFLYENRFPRQERERGMKTEGYYGNGQFVGPDPVPKLISGKRVIVVYLMENCKRIVGRVFPLKEIQQL